MASDKRVGRVAEQIRKELGNMLLRGIVRDAGFMTISEVRLSKDLGYARVFVSIMGEEKEQRRQLRKLLSASKTMRMALASRLRIRAVPELRFLLDDSLDRVATVDSLLKQLKEERGEGDDESPDSRTPPQES